MAGQVFTRLCPVCLYNAKAQPVFLLKETGCVFFVILFQSACKSGLGFGQNNLNKGTTRDF